MRKSNEYFPAGTKLTTLLIGFDSAWTPTNAGALVGVLRARDGSYQELGLPLVASFEQAEAAILGWQRQHDPQSTIVLIDQPTIVKNSAGQRPVENLVASPVSLRYGGVQPAHTGRAEMFGSSAPVWRFLTRFGGAADPLSMQVGTQVFETYPVLAMIALAWTLSDPRLTGRLPKYNPERKTFLNSDWRHVCTLLGAALRERHLNILVDWVEVAAHSTRQRKSDQDGLDACLCLLVAMFLIEQKDCLMVGNLETGYMVVPHGQILFDELSARCKSTGKESSAWVRPFKLARDQNGIST